MRRKSVQSSRMFGLLLAISMVATAGVGVSANAQSRPRDSQSESQIDRQQRDDIRRLDQRVKVLEDRLRNVEDYLSVISSGRGRSPIPEIVCTLEDSMTKRVFVGKADTKLEAEAIVKNECQKTAGAIFCRNSPKCETRH